MNIDNVEVMPRKMIWTGCLWICYADVPAAQVQKNDANLVGLHLEFWRYCGVGLGQKIGGV
jgi:hypothetical protein